MKKSNRYLTGILLILIGIIIGSLFAIFSFYNPVDDRADVEVTEVKHSSQPLFTDEELGKLDARFLFKQVAERVTPMVVYIEASVPFSKSDMPDDEFHDEDSFWGDIIPRRARTVGSGIVISTDGYILTNNHVIDGAEADNIEVVLNDKRTFQGRIVGQDPTTDLAVLKIDARGLPAITIGNSDEVRVGEWVLAIGNPFRLRSTVTAGIVSALSRDVQIINDQMRVESFIQTDAAINKGNSGGALVNTSGELIGVNTAIASQSGNYQGYGFAVPSNLASKVAEDIIEYGHVRRALLGVTIVSVDAEMAEMLDMDSIRGVYVSGVATGSAAAKHDIRSDDVILRVNGETVNESNQLQQKIAVLNPGAIVDLAILRDGKEMSKQVVLGMLERNEEELANRSESPPNDQDSVKPERQNFEKDNKSSQDRKKLNDVSFAEFDLGFRAMAIGEKDKSNKYKILVTDVVDGSTAARIGITEGQQILKVNNQEVEDLESLKHLIVQNSESENKLTIEIQTQSGKIKTLQFQ
ncbi:trypsin-like peptidase domain-containing protein [Fodinibius sp. Rm-B-1B1-1]|uniref:trypsin-like peptidase domain-containing protein n=1 Tax=Fodinibius alkaliphilus TaxID=3140241 RepID=UPI00315B0D46